MLYQMQMDVVSPYLSITFHSGITNGLNILVLHGVSVGSMDPYWQYQQFKWRFRLNHEIFECLKLDGYEVYLLTT